MENKILVFLEQRNGLIKRSSFEISSYAYSLSQKLNASIEAIAIGNDISNLEETGNYGISKVWHYKNAQLDLYSSSAYKKIISNHIRENNNNLVFFSNTSMGKDLSPLIAIINDGALVVDCTKLEIENDTVKVTRPVYAGKAFMSAELKGEVNVITIRPNTFPVTKTSDSSAEIEVKNVDELDLSVKVSEVIKSDSKLDVTEADIIVSGGRGLKAPENFKLVEELSQVLGAATGASRAVVDAGWRPHGEQVGQTGKTVSPNLYIALGISGAIQHLAGMRSSKYIVAINKDKDAPIFQVADYGIVGDIFEVVPELINELKKIKGNE
ncbi:MAG: electron transfer flavoprotein subunit alpha/FixB family protein [Ignavibacteriaceae bacterium]|jgi:electron transfer flavoprotein alpha subunit|nr:electron transfer flavoprotein subunit alpha/FixB family protein [Ignavibacteriaceae bacterium]